MAIDDESSSSSIVSSIGTSEDVQSFNSIHDNPNLKITSQLLDGYNYIRWAQSGKLFVGGHGKIGFLLGTEKEPVKSNSKYVKWSSDDSMESLHKVYSKRENNARIFQLSNEIENFKKGTKTFGMYYARLRSSWEELSHYHSFIEWPASAPSENVPIPPTGAEIYVKIVEKARVFQFLAGLNPNFEYVRVHILDRTLFPTLEEAYTYCLFDQSRRSPILPISGISSETSAMVVPYAYPAPPSVPSQTSHALSPSLSPLPAASGSQPPTPDYQVSFVALDLPPATDSPLSGIEPSHTASIPVTTDDDSPILTDAALLKRQKLEMEDLREKLQGSRSEVLELEVLKLRNDMLKYEVEREKLEMELEEERRSHKERELCLKEQQMQIENLNSLVSSSDHDKNPSQVGSTSCDGRIEEIRWRWLGDETTRRDSGEKEVHCAIDLVGGED
ncbi:hypothetical protein GIB67_018929 [Kingdonia uniflora]|uniref:Retrotransposon Copia-like N-terminal domain-containing protein n=1 Tax=Kingdonia uniflora TaxID=39325 RepID=A0A7J7L2L8_9MAGN|nr:hypothetical protein GIB67_018929 [Kingdonia uniflora]